MRTFVTALLLAAGFAGTAGADDREDAARIVRALKQIKDSDPRVRERGAAELRRVKKLNDAAVAALVAAAKDKEAAVRSEAVLALVVLPRGTPGVVAALTEAVGDADPWIRHSAIEGLGLNFADAKSAVPVLEAALKNDKEAGNRDAAWNALENVRGPSKETGGDGAVFGVGVPEGAKSVVYVVYRGGRLDASADSVRPELLNALNGLSRRRRFNIVWASEGQSLKYSAGLLQAGDEEKLKVAAHIKNMAFKGAVDVRIGLEDALRLEPDAVVLVTVREIDDASAARITARSGGKTRISVVSIIDDFGAEPRDNLKKLAADNGGRYREVDIHKLEVFGPAAFADDPDEPGDKRLARLLADLRSPEAKVRTAAAGALCVGGPHNKGAVEGLAAALKDAEPAVRLGAAMALEQIGKDAEPAAEALSAVMNNDKSDAIRDAAYGALEKIRPASSGGNRNGSMFGAGGAVKPNTVVYVIDRAGWMKPVSAAVDAELARAVGGLGRGQRFAAIWACDGFIIPGTWRTERATEENKKLALRDLGDIPARGRSDRTKALMDALAANPDTVYFVTGVELDAKSVAALTEKNAGKAVIHVVVFREKGDPPEKNLAKLAADNGGRFVGLDMKSVAVKKAQ